MTGFIISVFPFRNRVSSQEAFEGLELGEGKLSRPVLRGPGGRKAAWLLGSNLDPATAKIDSTSRVVGSDPRTLHQLWSNYEPLGNWGTIDPHRWRTQ